MWTGGGSERSERERRRLQFRPALEVEHRGYRCWSCALRQAVLRLTVPSVVDDRQYAVECAAFGEVDFEPLQAQIVDLEERLAQLEARFWLRVVRRLARLGRSRR